LEVFSAVKDRENDALLWGDEIEYHLMQFDAATKDVKIALIAHDAIEVLEKQDADPATRPAILSAWRPEYGSWMVEGKAFVV
jgi:glutamate--cysteine ligase catalytic subunit